MKIHEYPRPSRDTGIGVHWFPDPYHYSPEDLATFAPELSALGLSWLAMISDLDQTVPETFVRGLRELGIEPIVRICPQKVEYLDPDRLRSVCRLYASWGVHYVHVYQDPNMRDRWAQWDPRALPERFMTYLLPCLQVLHSIENLIPVLTPLAPGGDYDDLRFLAWCLDIIMRLGHAYLFDKLAIGIQNYGFNKSLTWGEGGPERWPCSQPYYTPPGCEDHVGFRLFEWYDALVRKRVGRSLPLVCCENGLLIGNAEHPDFPPVDAGLHAARTAEICRLTMEGHLPDYLFNNAFWVLACDTGHPASPDRWYTAAGEPMLDLTVGALKGMEKVLRPMPSPWPQEITMLRSGEDQIIALPLEEYVKGVLPREVGTEAPMEALKAMAVAARGYAVAATLSPRHGHQAAVCDAKHCQLWSPRRHSVTDQAVDDTRGLVPMHRDRPVATYYFGHCDGHTRNSEDVWVRALPYCRSVPCPCGYGSLYGHGVGLCQRGAIEMARRGATCLQILAYYYRGLAVWSPRGVVTPTPAELSLVSEWQMQIERCPGPLVIAGNLPSPGITVSVEDEWGNTVRTVSGSKAPYGQGGFEVMAWAPGRYTITFLDAAFQLKMEEERVLLGFRRQSPSLQP